MRAILGKSLILWASILPLAIANGALREYCLIPWMGNAAYPVSGVILCALLYAVSSVFVPRLGRGDKKTYRNMGLLWVVCTVVVETLLGMASGDPMWAILQNYNIFTGNLWLLVVVFFGFTPWLAAKRKGIV